MFSLSQMNMNTTTMNTQQNLLDQIARPFVAPRTKAVRLVPARRTAPVAKESALWQVTLAEARDTLAERALSALVATLAMGSLAWLVLVSYQFLLAWDKLATWVRAALM